MNKIYKNGSVIEFGKVKNPLRGKKKKLSEIAKIYIEQARCPRCDYKGGYSYISKTGGCCRHCAYPYGKIEDLYNL